VRRFVRGGGVTAGERGGTKRRKSFLSPRKELFCPREKKEKGHLAEKKR